MNLAPKDLEWIMEKIGPPPGWIVARRGLPGEDEVVVVTAIGTKPEPEYSQWLAKAAAAMRQKGTT